MIDRSHRLLLTKQARAVGIDRGSVYYLPKPMAAADLALMRRIDELHLKLPFAGSRMLRGLLNAQGVAAGRKHVAMLMRRMGIEALYRKPNTSRRHPGHKIYPYLLRHRPITAPNQAWAMDITYIPMARGFVYLAAVIDWYSRRVLAWRGSITMDTAFCLEAVEIDRKFVRDLAQDPVAQATVGCIREVAWVVGMCTVAEGLESEAVHARLRELGVHHGQGHHFNQPEPLAVLLGEDVAG